MIWDACDECAHALAAHKVTTRECSVCESEVWRAVAVALVAEIANEVLDPASTAMLAYGHARNHRYLEAIQAAIATTTPGAGTGSPTGNDNQHTHKENQ